MEGLRFVVTGAAGALGGAVVKELKAKGAMVAAIDRPGAVPPVPPRGWDVALEADLVDELAAARAVREAGERLGGLDGITCLAGGFLGDRLVHETPLAMVKQQFELNFVTAYNAVRAALPLLLERGGAVVCVTSRPALRPVRGSVAYAVAKLALVKLVELVAEEYRDQGIRANAVAPSIIDTPANRAAMPQADFRRWVSPEEVARAIVWLLGPESSAVSGAVVPVYGRA